MLLSLLFNQTLLFYIESKVQERIRLFHLDVAMETLSSSSRDVATRKVKDGTEKCSVIKLTYRHTYAIPIGPMRVSKFNHGALFSNIFNFAKCVTSVAK